MKKIILTIILYFFVLTIFAQKLSETAEISVLTCSPGKELYTGFGHSAFKVTDPSIRLNYVFNYGSFNFYTENFYLKFIRGRLNYMLAIENFNNFKHQYSKENRDVWEQVLNLNQEQKQALFDYLIWKSQEENKYYLYDFLFDNCATRIRDVLKQQLGDSIIFPEIKYEIALRDMLQPYLANRPWMRFGINTVLGTPADLIADIENSMFLPDYMDTAFTNTYIISDSGKIPLVKERLHIVQSIPVEPKPDFKIKFLNPHIVFWILFIFVFLFTSWEFYKKIKNYIIEIVFSIIFGLIGILILFMWLGTDHFAASSNFNFLWALPLHLIFAFFLFRKKKKNFVKYYFLIFSIYNLLFLILQLVIPQNFDIAIVPLILILTTRYFSAFWHLYKVKK